MIALEQIRKLPLREKLLVMETLWEEIARNDDQVKVPQLHKEILDQREELIRQGKAEFIDWQVAKEQITKAVS
jgi:putative addiction module component